MWLDLLEPPHPYDPGRKPKALTRKEVFKIVTLPRCCRNNAKGHAKCAHAINAANGVIKKLQEVADEQNYLLRNSYDNGKKKIAEADRFAKDQFKRAQKIVREKNELGAKVETKEKATGQAKGDKDDTEQYIRNLKSDIRLLLTENKQLKKDAKKRKEKYEEDIKKLKGKLQESIDAAVAQKRAPVVQSTQSSDASRIEHKRQGMELRYEFRLKDARQKDDLALQREERRAKQKDNRGQNVMSLLGTSGMFNSNQNRMLQQFVSFFFELCCIILFWHTYSEFVPSYLISKR